MTRELLASPFYKWQTWDPENLSNSSEVLRLSKDPYPGGLAPEPMFFNSPILIHIMTLHNQRTNSFCIVYMLLENREMVNFLRNIFYKNIFTFLIKVYTFVIKNIKHSILQ